MTLTPQEFYDILDNLGYNLGKFENLQPLPTSTTTTKPEEGNKPNFKNIGTFDVAIDEQVEQIKNESQIENTLNIEKLLPSYQLNAPREGLNIGAYLFEQQTALILIILQQMKERSGAWRYGQSTRYDIYGEATDDTKGVKYYSNINNNISNSLDSQYWKADTTSFDFTDWEVSGTENNIILTHQGAKKFDTAYLQDNLKLSFKPIYTNTSNATITIDGITKQLINQDFTLLAAGNIIANLQHNIEYNKNADVFLLHRIVYDRDNILVSGDDAEIKLISKGGIKFLPEMLYNGFSMSFITINNITSETSLDIDGNKYLLRSENGGEVENNRITAGAFITIYYNTNYSCFCISSNSYIKDEEPIGMERHTPVQDDISGNWLPLDGGTYNWADYPRFKEKCGGRFCDPQAGNINPICYTGGATIYIDKEETKQVGNSVFNKIVPVSIGSIYNKKPYGIVYNTIMYKKTDIDINDYSNDNTHIYTNSTPSVGDNIYNCPKEIEGETITSLLIQSLISNEITYTSDELGERHYNNNNYWTLTTNPLPYVSGNYIEDNYLLQAMDNNDNIVDPLTLKVAQIGSDAQYDTDQDTIIYNNNTYNRSSSVPKQNTQFVYNDGTQDYYLYALTTNIINGTTLFSKAIDKFIINFVEYTGFAIGNDRNQDFFVQTEEQQKYKNTLDEYRYSLSPVISEKCYLTPIQSIIGQVEDIEYSWYDGMNYFIRNNDIDNKIFAYNNPTISYYINNNLLLDIGSKLYNSLYPTAIGTYTAYTSVSITYNDTEYFLNDEQYEEYITDEGAKYYAINDNNIQQFYTSPDNRTVPISVLRKIDNKTYELNGGTIIHRAKAFDKTTFTLLDMTNKVFIGKKGSDTTLIQTNGTAPKFTGYFSAAIIRDDHGNGGIVYRTINDWYTGGDGVMWDAASAGIDRYNFTRTRQDIDPSRQWSVYSGNSNIIVPNGIYMIYYVKAR